MRTPEQNRLARRRSRKTKNRRPSEHVLRVRVRSVIAKLRDYARVVRVRRLQEHGAGADGVEARPSQVALAPRHEELPLERVDLAQLRFDGLRRAGRACAV